MNIYFAEQGADGQLVVHGQIEDFQHSCTIDGLIANKLSHTQAVELAETEIGEAYERYLSERL